jgi:hypothetical protein
MAQTMIPSIYLDQMDRPLIPMIHHVTSVVVLQDVPLSYK